jgi:hypothetical protein
MYGHVVRFATDNQTGQNASRGDYRQAAHRRPGADIVMGSLHSDPCDGLARVNEYKSLWLLKNYFRAEITRKFVRKWLIVRSRNHGESHEITVLVPFSTPTPVIVN